MTVYLIKDTDADAIEQRAIANLDATYDLIYVAYDDQLSDERIANWFTAETVEARWDVEIEVYDVFDETRYHSTQEAMKEALEAAAVDIWGRDNDFDADDFLIDHQLDWLRQEVWDRDQSNPFADLLRNTPNQLVRADLGDFDVPSAWSSGDDERTECIRDMAKRLGIDLDLNRDALEELFDNAGGGMLQIIWYADLADLMKLDSDSNRPSRATITDPYVIVIDSWNGAGHDVKVNGTFTFDLDHVVLDSKGGGYGWDQIASVVKSAYEPANITYHYPVSLTKRAA